MDMTQFLLRLQDHAERTARGSIDACKRTHAHLARAEDLHRQTIDTLTDLRTTLVRVVTSIEATDAPPIAPTSVRSRTLPVMIGILALALGLLLGHLIP
jgi:anti-sigma factor RsiW